MLETLLPSIFTLAILITQWLTSGKNKSLSREQLIYAGAEVAWMAVETMRDASGKKLNSTSKLNAFMLSLNKWLKARNDKDLTKKEFEGLKEWATMRSTAGKGGHLPLSPSQPNY